MQPSYVFWKDQFLRTEKVVISPDNRSFRYGEGCFETIRAEAMHMPLWPLHAQRFFATLRTLGFEVPAQWTAGWLQQRIEELLQKNGHGHSARIRLMAAGQEGGLYDAVGLQPQLLIQSWVLNQAHKNLNENGLDVGVYAPVQKAYDLLSSLKNNNFLAYIMAAKHAKTQKWNDALVLNTHGRIADTTIANFWWKKDGCWHTPALSEAPVAGVMRAHLLEEMNAGGLLAKESALHTDEIPAIEAAFVSNAVYGLRWIKWLHHTALPAADAAEIHRLFVQPLWKR